MRAQYLRVRQVGEDRGEEKRRKRGKEEEDGECVR
jgi:hypothetical protein